MYYSITQADWKDSFKKKQAGVSDMTLLSTISEDDINDNLKKRFENAEIYVSIEQRPGGLALALSDADDLWAW